MNTRYTSTLRLCFLIVLVGYLFGKLAHGQEEETFRFGWFADESAEGTEVLLFRPDASDDDHFFLYLESSNDLDNWQVDHLPRHAVDENGFVIVEGGAVQRKFWRLRIRPAVRADETWPSGLVVGYAEGVVTATLEVTTDYYPAVRLMIEDAMEEPVPWAAPVSGQDEAGQTALARLRQIVDATETRRGDVIEVRRGVDE